MALQAHFEDIPNPSAPLGREWEALVRASPASGVMQSLHWAAFRRREGFRVLFLTLRDGERLIGGMIGYAAGEQRAGLLVAPEGPVLPWADEELARAGLRALLAEAERRAPEYGALAIRIEPHLAPPRPGLLRACRRAPLDLLPSETLYLDLARPDDEILAQMRPKGRYNIRLARRHGVAVSEATRPDAVYRFYRVLTEAGTRDDFFVEPLPFFAALAEELCPAGIARFLFAEYAGETVGALLLVTYGDRATYLYGGIGNRQRHCMVGYALQWAAMRRGRELGCRVYDFYGYEPYGAPDHLYAGFSRFKRQFGGRPARFIGAHDYVFLDRLADAVVQAARETVPG